MMEIIVLSIVVPILLIHLLLKKKRAVNSISVSPPGPPGLPLIGNIYQFATGGHPHVNLWQLSKKYGPVMQMKLGSVPLLVISSARAAKEVLKTHDLAFCSRPELRVLKKMSYNGNDIVFSPYNEYWRAMRKVTAIHLFSLNKIKSFHPIREDEIVHRMVSRIASCCDHVVNLTDVATALTTTLTTRIAFGKRYDEQGLEMRRFDQLLQDAQRCASTFFVSDYFPWFGWMDKVIGSEDRLETLCKELDSFYQELIDEHLDPNRVKTVEMDTEDILDVLIRLKEENYLSPIDLTWDHIKALLMNIFIAATDTSAASVVWTMTALMKAPHIMKKLQAHIRESIGVKGHVYEDDLPKLPYLKAVVKEALRIYCPVPLLVPRETIETCTLEGYEIQPKTRVYVNAWAIGRDPEVWEKPDEFLPERFFNSDIDVRGQDYGVIPFGSGRRMCPGLPMGLVNVELTVANLIHTFDWELPAGLKLQDFDDDAAYGVTIHKKTPLCIVPKKCVA